MNKRKKQEIIDSVKAFGAQTLYDATQALCDSEQELFAAWNIINGYRHLDRRDLDIQVVDGWLSRNSSYATSQEDGEEDNLF